MYNPCFTMRYTTGDLHYWCVWCCSFDLDVLEVGVKDTKFMWCFSIWCRGKFLASDGRSFEKWVHSLKRCWCRVYWFFSGMSDFVEKNNLSPLNSLKISIMALLMLTFLFTGPLPQNATLVFCVNIRIEYLSAVILKFRIIVANHFYASK